MEYKQLNVRMAQERYDEFADHATKLSMSKEQYLDYMFSKVQQMDISEENADIWEHPIFAQLELHNMGAKQAIYNKIKEYRDAETMISNTAAEEKERFGRTITTLLTDKEQLQTALEDSNKIMNEAEERLAKTLVRNLELDEQIRTFAKSVSLLEYQNEQLNTRIAHAKEMENESETLKSEISEAAKRINDLERNFEQSQLEYRLSRERVAELESRLSAVKTEYAERLELESVNRVLKAVNEARDEYDKRIVTLQERIQHLSDEKTESVNQVLKTITEVRDECDKRMAEMQERIQQLNDERTALVERLNKKTEAPTQKSGR